VPKRDNLEVAMKVCSPINTGSKTYRSVHINLASRTQTADSDPTYCIPPGTETWKSMQDCISRSEHKYKPNASLRSRKQI